MFLYKIRIDMRGNNTFYTIATSCDVAIEKIKNYLFLKKTFSFKNDIEVQTIEIVAAESPAILSNYHKLII